MKTTDKTLTATTEGARLREGASVEKYLPTNRSDPAPTLAISHIDYATKTVTFCRVDGMKYCHDPGSGGYIHNLVSPKKMRSTPASDRNLNALRGRRK